MPWYWTDEVAPLLVADGAIDPDTAAGLIALPVGYRSDHDTIEDAARDLLEDDEIPLAA